jgi:pimeloyl-ACP methyl ester carboxylesterase
MRSVRLSLTVLLSVGLSLLAPLQAVPAAGATAVVGRFPDGATYRIDVPAGWNGTLALYSHGYTVNPLNPPQDAPDALTAGWLLDHGYALAGSSYATTGWAVEQAVPDQLQVLDAFATLVGRPRRTIAWGHSLGGMITAALVQLHPERFAGAMPMCGVLGGAVGAWNQALDAAFVFKTLLAPRSPLELVHVAHPLANTALAASIATAAQLTAAGRARIALAAAMVDLPGWFDPAKPEPAPDAYLQQEANQYLWELDPDLFFSSDSRAEMERRAGGNPSWNTGVDYARQLQLSTGRAEVEGLYAAAGLDLSADLETLAAAPRISADPDALAYLQRNVVFDGRLGGVPVLSVQTVGDGLVPVDHERAYADVVAAAGDAGLLRQLFVHRAGHCTFTPAETLAAFQALVGRLDTGGWQGLAPEALNGAAVALGPALNTAQPAYLAYQPPVFLREYDSRGGS